MLNLKEAYEIAKEYKLKNQKLAMVAVTENGWAFAFAVKGIPGGIFREVNKYDSTVTNSDIFTMLKLPQISAEEMQMLQA